MLPIWGGGGVLLEHLHDRLATRGMPRWRRALVYMAGVYGIEYGSAALLNRIIGDVPWRYFRGINVRGYVRLDYAPFWYACGWLFESVMKELRKLDRPARKEHRPRVSARAASAAAAARPPAASPLLQRSGVPILPR